MNKKVSMAFTDGSSRGNPGSGGWGAVIVTGDDHVIELGIGVKGTTNNRMELSAVVAVIQKVNEMGIDVVIRTDSQYVINGATKWVYGWEKNNWITSTKTDVINKDLWSGLLSILREYMQTHTIEWVHVPGHAGLIGNERADEIATLYADEKPITLYDGELHGYTIDIKNLSVDQEKLDKKKASKKRSSQKAFSYVSSVAGEVVVHATWPECEKRVKGKKGVRFKKVFSKQEESELTSEWGM